jgi:23S rRNA pseudouridine2605 synthase
MRDKPHPHHKLEWPGGVVPEWARPQKKQGRFGRKGKAGGAGGKRERLQKVMAQSGYGSRRNIEILIAQGHLTINGEVAKLGDSVGPGDKVKLDGNLINLRFGDALPRVLLYHKPEGEIVTRDDPEKRATVFDKLPKVNNGRWVSVGRLDLNTGGLLMFTTSGELANRLTHPRFEVEREYAVRVMGEIDEDKRKQLLETGIDIDGENCKFDSLEDRGGEGANHWYHVVLREGKNREVRRMMEGVGLMVSRLMRVRFGNVELPGHIKRGMFREMEEEQVQELLAFAGMNEQPPAEDGEEAEEDELDNIGNRIDPREAMRQEPEIPEDIGNRFTHHHAKERPEPDGNRGQYIPGGAPASPGKQKQGPRRLPQGAHGKPFFNKKRGAGHGQDDNRGNVAPPAHRTPHVAGEGQPHPGGQRPPKHKKHRKPHSQPAQAHGQQGQQAQGAPQGPKPHGQAVPPGQGKPGRNRRNKNRNRNRGAQGGGEQQPAASPNPNPEAA